PKVIPSKPTVINESSVGTSTQPPSSLPPTPISAPVKVTVLQHDALVKESFDVMLSYELCFTSDGAIAATGDDKGVIIVWNVARASQVRKMTGHKSQVLSLAFSADNRRLLSASMDGTVREWDYWSESQIRSMKGPEFTYLASVGQLKGACYTTELEKLCATFVIHKRFAVC
ncbi:U3 snoRNP protein, partial [Blyttiomyces sp. JEL0837]